MIKKDDRTIKEKITHKFGVKTLFKFFVVWLLIIGPASITTAQPTDPDDIGRTYKGTHFPLGERSFADRVVEYTPGPGIIAKLPNYMDPAHALGPPDEDPTGDPWTAESLVSLGCGGTVVLEFVDNELIDVDGPDLHVFEAGSGSAAKEPTRLYISKDGVEWLDVGEIPGSYASVDISTVARGLGGFRYVKLVDLKAACAGWNTPGADIDAVGAIGSVPLEEVGVTLEAPGGLYWDKSEVSEIKVCLDLTNTSPSQARAFALEIKQTGAPDNIVLRANVTSACASWALKPGDTPGTYILYDELGRSAHVLQAGRYHVQVKGWAQKPNLHIIQPEAFQLTLHPPLQIEIFDKATNEILVPGNQPHTLGHIVLDKEFRIRVTDSPYLRSFPETMPCKIKSSNEEITHVLPQLEHSGGSVNVWQHMREQVAAKYIPSPSSNVIDVPRTGGILEITCKQKTVKLRVSASGHYKAAALIEERMREILEVYELVYQNPMLESSQKPELLAKIGLLKRALALHDRGDVPAYLLLPASIRYMQLLALSKSELGNFDTSRIIDPNTLPEGMRGTPVNVPYAEEERQFYIAKRQDAVQMLSRDFRRATHESVMAMVQLPNMILDAPKMLAESINIVWTGRNLAGQWASSDEHLAAVIDLGGLAFGPLVRGAQGLRALHGRRLFNPDGMRVVGKAKDALGVQHLSTQQARKIVAAHRVGRPPYNQGDIYKKMRLLTNKPPKGAGLTRQQASLLMREGITGTAEPSLLRKLSKKDRTEYNRLTEDPTKKLTKEEYEKIQKWHEEVGDLTEHRPETPQHKAKRWDDYKKRPEKEGKKKWEWEQWSKQYDINMDNYKRGLKDQEKALKKLGIENNDTNGRFEFKGKDKATDKMVTTRPDGVTDHAIVEFKSMTTKGALSERVLNLDPQLRMQQAAAKRNGVKVPPGLIDQDRKFIVVMQSEKRSLVRPSKPLAEGPNKADFILHRNRINGHWALWKDDAWVDYDLESARKLIKEK